MAEAAVEYWPMAYYGKKRRYLPCCHRPRPCGREEGGEEITRHLRGVVRTGQKGVTFCPADCGFLVHSCNAGSGTMHFVERNHAKPLREKTGRRREGEVVYVKVRYLIFRKHLLDFSYAEVI